MFASRLLSNTARQFVRRGIATSQTTNMPAKVGDRLPNVPLMENNPGNKVNLEEIFRNKKGILFAVPGAFTPTCHKTHLPGYVEDYDKLKAKGVEVIACVSVNDPFVMEAWAENSGATGKIRMLADPQAEFTKALEMDFDASGPLGNVRSKRYSMVVVDSVIKAINVEPDNVGATCSLSNSIVNQL
ncbi:peroxiredoxin-5, mitochondrial-like [Amphiura filiformis]|uniref:peroxiredoxin-5, mitochondrial-like n=1 Tax=Amphiura filiformis TaxID=82378 RepID=UPI003B2137D6